MGKIKIKLIFRKRAQKSIRNFAINIKKKGYPEAAENFAEKLFAFGNSINIFPEKYAICRKPSLAKRKFRCAVFKNNYIFIYKIIKNELIIFNVIHSSRYSF